MKDTRLLQEEQMQKPGQELIPEELEDKKNRWRSTVLRSHIINKALEDAGIHDYKITIRQVDSGPKYALRRMDERGKRIIERSTNLIPLLELRYITMLELFRAIRKPEYIVEAYRYVKVYMTLVDMLVLEKDPNSLLDIAMENITSKRVSIPA